MNHVRRLACVVVATALTTALVPAVGATAEPTQGPRTPPPISVTPEAPERETATTSEGLRDAGVAGAYKRWRSGKYRPGKGVGKNSLRVQIENASSTRIAALARKLGAKNVEKVTDSVVVADVPFDKLQTLQDASPSVSVTLPTTVNVVPQEVDTVQASSSTRTGGEILSKTNAAAWQATGLTGAGVKIGVIDYFGQAAWDRAAAAGEVRSRSSLGGTFCRYNGSVCSVWITQDIEGAEHGVAVAEILHDMAPGATLYLATADTLADTRAAIDYFVSKGVKIVTRSLTAPYDGPGDGTGPAADLVDYAVSKGMAWFNATGNAGRWVGDADQDGQPESDGGYWRGTWRDSNGDELLDFTDPAGLTDADNVLPVACGFFNGLRWNDWGESERTDYDLYAFSRAGTLIARSERDQVRGADPLEGVSGASALTGNFNAIDCDTYPTYYLAITRHNEGGDANDTLEILVNSALYFYASTPHSAGQPFADSKNPGAAAVGAVDPVGGEKIGEYSSQGPTNDVRIKPDLSAGAGFSSYSYSPYGFSGTSAAAPVVAGAAALILQSQPGLTPAQLVGYLKTSAVTDWDKDGADNAYGAGELQLATTRFSTPGSAPTITGAAKVGATLKAGPSTGWSPSASSVTYAWYADGRLITGATSASLTLTSAQCGKKITVKARAAAAGRLPTLSTSSNPTAKVAVCPLTTAVPRITGTLAAGQKATASTGTWTKGTKLTYQWYANGKKIKGATKSKLKLTKAQNGKKLSVTVTGTLTGYVTASRTSATTAKVLTARTPTITGIRKVGKTLKVSKGTWTKKTKFSYRWYANGKAIKGATKSKLKLTKSLKGKTITVKLTGKKSGYTTVTLTSKKTSKIKK